MTITEVQIRPVKPQEGLIAFASCVLDEKYYVGSIAVFTKLNGGYRLVFPTKAVGSRQMHLHHPITQGMSMAMEEAIFEKVRELFD